MKLRDLYDKFRDPKAIKALSLEIKKEAKNLKKDINIMEVCGGHTHTLMKYALLQLLPKNINFIHGPGCPVCVMPKERIDHAYILSMQKDVILCTLGDMIKVPGSNGSLQDARGLGSDVRFVYSPLDVLKIAKENSDKKIIFFAIGFETTTPMTCALIESSKKHNITNILYHINHVRVPEPMEALLNDDNNIDAFLGPSHVSVIMGSKIYDKFATYYKKPVVVSGFEPVDMLEAILMVIKQFVQNRCEVEIQYKRAVTKEGQVVAKKLIDRYFIQRDFRWRGIGDIPNSALKLKDEFKNIDAEYIYKDILPTKKIDDNKLCICGEILKGKAKPKDCKVFGTACTPSTPLGSCMVSSEGACAAYYRYKNIEI